MTKIYFYLALLIAAPILIPVVILESSIAIPIMLFAIVRLKMKQHQRDQALVKVIA